MLPLLLVPAALQAVAMGADKLIFHRRRTLPRWERIGHPLDTLSVFACYARLLLVPHGAPRALAVYIALAAFSCLLVTKDEPVHAKFCGPGECWLHAVLFILHPVVFAAFGVLWASERYPGVLAAQCALTLAFAVYQFTYWSILWKPRAHSTAT